MSGEHLVLHVQELKFKEGMSGGFFSDPAIYIKILYNGEELKGETKFGEAQNPHFNDEHDLGNGCDDDKIVVQCFSEGTFSDDFIGECNVFMDSLKVGTGVRDGFTMLKETDSIGVVFLKTDYTPPEAPEEPPAEEPAPEVMAAEPYQQQMMMQQPMQ